MRYREGIYLYLIFFPAGFAILANAQRYAELQKQLNLGNGEFGTYISLMALGSIICFTIGPKLIHIFGIGKTLLGAMIGMYSIIGAVPHVHSVHSFIIINLIYGFMTTIMHISINAQGIHVQHKTGKLLLPMLSGIWSAGAVLTSLLSSLVAKHLSLSWHIDGVAGVSFLIAIIGLYGMRRDLLNPREEYDAVPSISLKTILNTFKFIPALSFGHILIVQSEFAAGDWSSIFAHNSIGVSVAAASLCYLVFMTTMAFGRIFAHKINFKYSEAQLIKWVPRFGSFGFGAFLILSTVLAKEHRLEAFVCALIAYIFLGAGNSFLIPMIFGIAARKSNVMPGMVIASMGLVGASLSFLVKIVISWVAQATNLTVALLIPTAMLFAGSTLSRYGSTQPKAVEKIN